MPRSSRSKSHKQSKHSSKEYSGSDEDAVSFRVSKDSGEKRKHSKDLCGSHVNGDVSEDYTTSLKRREEKSHGGGGSDRWNGGSSEEKVVVNVENKELKSKDFSKVASESKSKSSRRHDGESVGVVVVESRGEKRKSEKESVRKESSYKESKELKDKDRGSDRGRKVHVDKVEAEVSSKQGEHQTSKRGKEITEWPIEEELRNPELEKELEKRIRRRGEGSSDKDKYPDDVKVVDDRRLSTKSDRAKDERHKDEGYGDTYREESVRETKQRDDKHREDGERDRKNRDVKHRGESERFNKHKDDKDKYREDKYREDVNRDSKYKDEKNHEDGDRDAKRRDDKHVETGDRDERSRDGKRKHDDDRDYRHKEEKHREDADRDHRHRDSRHRDDTDREKRARDSKYRDARDHPVESEAKRLRDDGSAADLYHRKANNRDGSPIYDDRVARHKDDKDRRRGTDKDEPSDYRSHSVKEQRSESEKRSSAKVDSVSERGRLSSRYADMENTGSHSRRRSSPGGSSHPARDHYRGSKLEETKYREYGYEDRTRHNVHSSRDFTSAPGQSEKLSSRPPEKVTSKDDNYTADLPVERRLRPDARSSPQVDKSPSSTSNERRNLTRSDIRKSLDVEEPGHRSGGSKDAKDGKGSRELGIDPHPDNDYSQADGDNMSVSSPYARSSHFSVNSFIWQEITGSDRPLCFGYSEDDRNKSNNRHRRMGDPNMGRAQGNWKNVPSWPSPMAATGGYLPFQHVPPPMFHPVMQQFPPPIFGRPPMKLNPGLPYHVPDHGPPPMHGWDPNNTVFGDESHLYGRLDWDRRTQLSNRGWDPSAEMWKSQNAGASMDMQSGPQKDYSTLKSMDEMWPGQTGQHIENEQSQLDIIQSVTMNGDQSGDVLARSALEGLKVTESPVAEEDDTLVSKVYLSKVDVSEDLTQPELYDQCSSMMDLDQESLSDEFDCKILFLEEDVEASVTNNRASLFAAINDSVFQKAMFLYKKQKDESHSLIRPVTTAPESVPASDQDKDGSDNDVIKPMDEEAVEGPVLEAIKEKDEPVIQNQDAEPLNEAKLTLVKQEEEEEVTDLTEPPSVVGLVVPCKVEEASECTNNNDNGSNDGGDGDVLCDESTTSMSVNLSRIHHHSPESTH